MAHLLGLDWECRTKTECEGKQTDGPSEPSLFDSVLDDSDSAIDFETEEEEEGPESTFRSYKRDDSTLRDQQSTGRKRAAREYPLDKEKLCEWAGKVNCGGGSHPITGCESNLQQARHHGPDKNTLNNEEGNVHRICHLCHNRWHTLNDDDYIWNDVYVKHAPRQAIPAEIKASEDFWSGRKLNKPEH